MASASPAVGDFVVVLPLVGGGGGDGSAARWIGVLMNGVVLTDPHLVAGIGTPTAAEVRGEALK